jgi:hypothetical protein
MLNSVSVILKSAAVKIMQLEDRIDVIVAITNIILSLFNGDSLQTFNKLCHIHFIVIATSSFTTHTAHSTQVVNKQ